MNMNYFCTLGAVRISEVFAQEQRYSLFVVCSIFCHVWRTETWYLFFLNVIPQVPDMQMFVLVHYFLVGYKLCCKMRRQKHTYSQTVSSNKPKTVTAGFINIHSSDSEKMNKEYTS